MRSQIYEIASVQAPQQLECLPIYANLKSHSYEILANKELLFSFAMEMDGESSDDYFTTTDEVLHLLAD